MKRAIVTSALLAAGWITILPLAGCSGNSREQIMNEALTQIGELYFIYRSIKSEDEVPIVRRDIQRIFDNLKKLKKRLDDLPEMTESEKRAFEEKYAPVLKAIYKNMKQQAQNTRGKELITYVWRNRKNEEGTEGPVAFIERCFIPQKIKIDADFGGFGQ